MHVPAKSGQIYLQWFLFFLLLIPESNVLQDMKKFEIELRALQAALEQAQAMLTSPELGHLSLKEQLSHRQVKDQDLKVNIWGMWSCIKDNECRSDCFLCFLGVSLFQSVVPNYCQGNKWWNEKNHSLRGNGWSVILYEPLLRLMQFWGVCIQSINPYFL